MRAIRRFFGRLFIATFDKLHTFHVRPRLEYGGPAAFQFAATGLVNFKGVQRRAKRIVDVPRGINCEDRFDFLKLYPVGYRRLYKDLICLWKFLHRDMELETKTMLSLCAYGRTRGHWVYTSECGIYGSSGATFLETRPSIRIYSRLLWSKSLARLASTEVSTSSW